VKIEEKYGQNITEISSCQATMMNQKLLSLPLHSLHHFLIACLQILMTQHQLLHYHKKKKKKLTKYNNVWISFLAYPNLFGIKGFVVVVTKKYNNDLRRISNKDYLRMLNVSYVKGHFLLPLSLTTENNK
jgi:hypothetical protein